MGKLKLPNNLDESFYFLENEKIDGLDEWLSENIDSAIASAHHGLGRWIRNSFSLWEQKPNKLRQWFIDNFFIDNPDDISSLILINFHQIKNGNIPNLNKYIYKYHKHWEKTNPNYKLKLRKHKLNKLIRNF
jgi:hypothetical protein